ncbi:hypothetical protein ACIRQQ_16980 [Streptomyces fuscichromogenes]|uniref:hypothetical protein n=1 Tax=Streptomyces fuscichromogenes TaxID=1324013 RepID=UPI00380436F3
MILSLIHSHFCVTEGVDLGGNNRDRKRLDHRAQQFVIRRREAAIREDMRG